MPEDSGMSVEERIAFIDKEKDILFLTAVTVLTDIYLLDIEKNNLQNPDNVVDTFLLDFVNSIAVLIVTLFFFFYQDFIKIPNKNKFLHIFDGVDKVDSQINVLTAVGNIVELLIEKKEGTDLAAPPEVFPF